MTKEPDKRPWEENYKNKSLSGIEYRDKRGKICNFVRIQHDEILENNTPHRISIRLDEKAEPILPPPQTFEEIIQAKRRFQMLLYGPGNSTSSAILADRSRRIAAARQVAAASNLNRRPIASSSRRRPVSSRSKKSKKKPRPKPTIPAEAPELIQTDPNQDPDPEPSPPPTPPAVPQHAAEESSENDEAEAEPVAGTSNGQMVTSLKDLSKPDNPLLKSVDPKEVKLLLKSAPPGASITLSNGTVIKKSRRGGARVGAGRKRSRPMPPDSLSPGSRNSNGNHSLSTSSSFSSA